MNVRENKVKKGLFSRTPKAVTSEGQDKKGLERSIKGAQILQEEIYMRISFFCRYRIIRISFAER